MSKVLQKIKISLFSILRYFLEYLGVFYIYIQPKTILWLLKCKCELNLKIGIKTGQPCWLNAIIPAGAKNIKNASFLANVLIKIINMFL